MEYAKARELKNKSLSDLIAEKIVSNQSIRKSITSSIGEKFKGKATRIKEKFDPLNIAKFLTGGSSLAPAVLGKLLGRSSNDISYFSGVKSSKKASPINSRNMTVGSVQQTDGLYTKLGPGRVVPIKKGDGAADVVAKLYNLLKKSYDDKNKMFALEKRSNIANRKDSASSHKKLLAALLGAGLAGGANAGEGGGGDGGGDGFLDPILKILEMAAGAIGGILAGGLLSKLLRKIAPKTANKGGRGKTPKERGKTPKDRARGKTPPKETPPKENIPKETPPKENAPKENAPKETPPKENAPKETAKRIPNRSEGQRKTGKGRGLPTKQPTATRVPTTAPTPATAPTETPSTAPTTAPTPDKPTTSTKVDKKTSKIASFVKKLNAALETPAGKKIVKVAGKATAGIAAAAAVYNMYNATTQWESGEINDFEYRNIIVKGLGSVLGGEAGVVIGGLLGVVGGPVGVLAGSIAGGYAGYVGGEKVAEMIIDAVDSKLYNVPTLEEVNKEREARGEQPLSLEEYQGMSSKALGDKQKSGELPKYESLSVLPSNTPATQVDTPTPATQRLENATQTNNQQRAEAEMPPAGGGTTNVVNGSSQNNAQGTGSSDQPLYQRNDNESYNKAVKKNAVIP